MKELQRLNLSHNALGPTIGPRDLRGLDGLRVLDISHNQLTTLEDTSEVTPGTPVQPFRLLFCSFFTRVAFTVQSSWLELAEYRILYDCIQTWLPSLEELKASHNRLVTLSGRDFRGFPVLCWADISMNQIRTLMPELVANTRCTIHGVPDVLRIYLQGEFILDSLTSETPLLAALQCHAQRSPSRMRVNASLVLLPHDGKQC